MKLIIGGAYQGKLTWAVEQFGLAPDTLCDLAQGFQPENAAITTLRRLRARRNRQRRSCFQRTQSSSRARSGSGVVPMDAAERAWRERHGALLQQLSRRSETVIRIFCGLPQQLKP